MKTRIAIKIAAVALALILGRSLQGTAQTVQYATVVAISGTFSNDSLPVQTNQLVSVVGYSSEAYVTAYFANGLSVSTPATGLGGSTLSNFTFTGLTNVEVVANNGVYPVAATFQITTPASATVISNYVPADAIVIPSSATGNVQIILESSSDLVNWTAAEPGTYGATAGTNRFFRVRAAVN